MIRGVFIVIFTNKHKHKIKHIHTNINEIFWEIPSAREK